MTLNISTADLVRNVARTLLTESGVRLMQNPTARAGVARRVARRLEHAYENPQDQRFVPGVARDRAAAGLAILGSIERAIGRGQLSPAALRAVASILVQGLFIEGGDKAAVESFRQRFGIRPPTFLVISPTKACNLHCTGCYAGSGEATEKLDWETVNKVIGQARALWGSRFFVFSGGEPFIWRSEGRGMVDLAEEHNDCLFLVYTNGTLLSDEVVRRLAAAGNLMPAISLEGWREATDARRGAGMFDRIQASMNALRTAGVPFGVSLTATRANAEELLSRDFVHFLIEQGALFAWIFQYLPIGRGYSLDMMPTHEQRLWMWRRSWEVMREERFFLADFWNQGTLTDGCLAAGGADNGGYFYIDWNGDVAPCVFMPYAAVNIRELFARGGDLIDMWNEPFFAALRAWKTDFIRTSRNQLAPCPYRDHQTELQKLVHAHHPRPTDAGAADAMSGQAYYQDMAAYGQAWETMTNAIWEADYLQTAGVPEELRKAV